MAQEQVRRSLIEIVLDVISHIDIFEGKVVVEVCIIQVERRTDEVRLGKVIGTRLEVRWV